MKGKLTRTERTIRSIELADKINISDSKLKYHTMLYALLEKSETLKAKKIQQNGRNSSILLGGR